MDYERENAKEWQPSTSSAAPVAGTSKLAGAGDGHELFAAQWQSRQPRATHETSDHDESGWQQVTHKKQPKVPARVPAKNPPKPPLQPIAKLPVNPAAKPVSRYVAKSPARPIIRFQPSSKAPPPLRRVPPKTRMILFSNKNDNLARADFRAQKPHTNTFLLSKNCYAIEPERERLYDILEEMGVRLGSFIRPPQSATDRKLLLWGNEEQTSETIKELNQWVLQSNVVSRTVRHGVAFAKTGLVSEDKAEKLDKEMRRLAMKIKYQKAPDPNLSFPYTGYFSWPVDEIRPDDLLGPSYEAFDPIRMAYHSYILFNNQLSAFQILSLEKDAVEHAMERIKGTMKEFVARNSREITMHMIERPQARLMRENVRMKEGHDMVPVLTGKHLAPSKLAEWDRERKRVEDHQFAQWRQTLDRALKRLRYYRGHVRMRVLLGTFSLTSFRRWGEGIESIAFPNFVKDMDLTATKGCMKRE